MDLAQHGTDSLGGCGMGGVYRQVTVVVADDREKVHAINENGARA